MQLTLDSNTFCIKPAFLSELDPYNVQVASDVGVEQAHGAVDVRQWRPESVDLWHRCRL